MRPFTPAHSLSLILLLSPLRGARAQAQATPTASLTTSYPTASGLYTNLTASTPVFLVSNTTTASPTTGSATSAPAATVAAPPASVVFSTEMATAVAAAPTTVTSIVVAPLGGVTGMQTLVTLPGATSTRPVGGVQTGGVGSRGSGGWRFGVGVGAGLWLVGWR
ncbi:hypothetical protein MMC15_000739 [Xylographa vitiligo]|nr:hypothetical protein [Xylographa vitiligo]